MAGHGSVKTAPLTLALAVGALATAPALADDTPTTPTGTTTTPAAPPQTTTTTTPAPTTPAPEPEPEPAPQPPAPQPQPPAPAAAPDPAPAPRPAAIPAAERQAPQRASGRSVRKPGPAGLVERKREDTPADAAKKKQREKQARRKASRERTTHERPDRRSATAMAAAELATFGPIAVPSLFIKHFRIPPFLLPIYQAAGIEYGVRWEILAAINEIETDYGRNLNVSSAGATGWMQFMPASWRSYGVDADGDHRRDPYNPVDAIFAAARYLKAAGADTDIREAIFAYNHAGWYVDSVLLRARLIAASPPDLIAALTDLTQGRPPVAGPFEQVADDARRSILLDARAGAPAVAVRDGRIVRIGRSPRLGRFVMLQDVSGNTYTYGGLQSVARMRVVAKPHADARKAHTATRAARDPRPTRAASDDRQEVPLREAPPRERLYANPLRPRAFRTGGEEQVLANHFALRSYLVGDLAGLRRSDLDLKRLRVGSRVIAGAILGRVDGEQGRLRFEIRPAGREAPRIDPRPILDGWRLLAATAVHRRAGRPSLLGGGARDPFIGPLLLLSKQALARRVLADRHIRIYAGGEHDIRTGQVDRRVLATLAYLSASGLRPTVSSLKTGHGYYTASGNVSEHSSGNAVDISAINGIPIAGHQGDGSVTDLAIRRLLMLQGAMKPHQIISLRTYAGADNTLSLPDHGDHIHVGFQPPATSAGGRRRIDATLQPDQWDALIARLGTIENPEVPLRPSPDALPASSARSGAPAP